MWKNRRVFVSGGNGVIGRELVRKLYGLGATLMVGDLKPCGNDLPAGIIYRQGDLNYCESWELLGFAPETFFHLAATFERSTETYDFWGENYWHNVRLSHHLMTILKDCPSLSRIVFASSYLIYDQQTYQFAVPQAQAVRLKESDAVHPRNLTGMAKFSHEMELEFVELFQGSKSFVLPRIYRVYGKGSNDVVARWVRDLLAGKDLTVYRKEGVFDYIYAGDVAEGLIRIAESDHKGVVNLGRDHARTVEAVLGVLRKHFPAMCYTEVDTNIPYEASQANMDLFEQVTGWKPATEIENGIPLLIEYERQRGVNNDTQTGNILVSSASAKVPLLNAVRQAASRLVGQQAQIIAGDGNEACLARHFCYQFWNMPPLVELEDENALLRELRERNIAFVIPTRDGELSFWSRKRDFLATHGIHVMVSAPSNIDCCLDKLEFSKRCQKLGIPAIVTADTIDDLPPATRYVVKERYGAGSLQLGLCLNRVDALKHAKSLKHPIFQPYVQGDEYSVDAYVDRNRQVKGLICRRREVLKNGESQVTATVRDVRLEQACGQYIQAFNLYGHVILQLFVDEQAKIHLIECNARFGGASTLSLAAGLDSFFWFFLEASGTDVSAFAFIPATCRLRQVRVPQDFVFTVE